MAKNDTFSVSNKSHAGYVVTVQKPDSIRDPQWKKMIAGDVEEALNELAYQNWVIKAQASGRGELPKGKAAVQHKVDTYKYGAKGGASAPVVDGTGFSAEQVAMLKAAGVVVVTK